MPANRYHGNLKNPDAPPTFRQIASTFFRIGNSTFGGGYVTIGMLEREMVEQRAWISRDQFSLAFAMARITPGTILLAFCAATGDLLGGFIGAIIAILALTVPSAAIAVFLIDGFESWQSNAIAAALIGGTVAAVAGMMWSTIWTILQPLIGGLARNLQTIAIAGGAALASWQFGVSPLTIILAGMLAGFLWRVPEPVPNGPPLPPSGQPPGTESKDAGSAS